MEVQVTSEDEDFHLWSLEIFFNFNPFLNIILNLTLSFFFKTNTFGRVYCHGTAKCLCRAMHGGAAEALHGGDHHH